MTTTTKPTRKPRARKANPPPARVSERVLRRLLALAKADGLAVRTIEEDELHGYGKPPAVTFTPDTPAAEQAIDVAWSLGFQRMRTASWYCAAAQEEQNGIRVDRFAATLLANLCAAEALALQVD